MSPKSSRVWHWWGYFLVSSSSWGANYVIFKFPPGSFRASLHCTRAAGHPPIAGCGFVPASPIPTWEVPELPPKTGAQSWGGRDWAKLR